MGFYKGDDRISRISNSGSVLCFNSSNTVKTIMTSFTFNTSKTKKKRKLKGCYKK